MTAAVVSGAAYALWLGLPLLNPGLERFDAHDIPVINTDAQIVRPLPSTVATSLPGVVNPGSLWAKPKPSAVVHKSAAKHHSSTVARASGSSATDEAESDSD
jgi:hypothetical protein